MRQRLAVGGAVAGTLGLMITLIYFGSQPEYGVLFSDLKTNDAQTIVEKLKAANVPYRLSNGGTMISVPNERVPELRLQMAASNTLTGGHIGFDIFDRNNFGATDFTQKVNYQRALEGELARTLEGMDEVETARVHITAPRESVFAEKAERGKASVVLRMRQARELSRERTDAIVNLIASSAEGLDPADVSVMDTRGRLLTAPGRNNAGVAGATAFSSHLEARQKLETETAARIVALLEPIVGKGHVQADVAADVDFSQIEQTEEKYDPKSSVIRSQQSTAEYRTPVSSSIGGVTGARGNDPNTRVPPPTPTPTPTPTPQPGQAATPQPTPAMPPQLAPDQRNASTINYEIDKTVRRTVGGLGQVTRLSASVLVDHKAVNGASVARAPEELKRIQDLVAAAIGADSKRGDQVVVESFPFDKATSEPAKPSAIERYRDMIQVGIKYGSLVLAALLLIFFVVRPAQKALKASSAPEPKLLAASTEGAKLAGATARTENGEPLLAGRRDNELEAPPTEMATVAQLLGDATPRTVAELEAEMNSHREAEKKANLESPTTEIGTNEPLSPRALRERLAERSRKEPEVVAMTLRGWLQEVR
ncbi:MAG: flagellar M-ring protein FliF [Acidobacteria bacterium]|nr:flagellar M-ring protein FliF [Acidobacteriota bacterium]